MDAHLAISNSLDLSKDMFEFVFGAGSNTICSIRSCRQFCQITKTFDRTLSCNEFRKVWIAWGPPGVRLGVGGKADNNTLLTTTCGASLTVHHVWISMYETTSGDWRVDCTYNETSASTKSDLAKSTATPTPTAQNTTQSSMQETTTSAASSPSPNTSRYFCEQVRQSSIEMTAEKIVKELRLKEQTSARRRQLETTSDHRASAQLMGLTAVAVLVTVALAVIIPDLIALFVWTTVKLQMVKKQGLKTSRLSPEFPRKSLYQNSALSLAVIQIFRMLIDERGKASH
ncbi:uncharacterized protein LOC112557343 isoform X1 [Pomacea canaliculata]|nr:uncharacterized protein LOC112557343 isoform X1 [Pomacea canaliculata]